MSKYFWYVATHWGWLRRKLDGRVFFDKNCERSFVRFEKLNVDVVL